MKVVEDRTVVFFFGVGLMFISKEYFNHLAIENHQLISPSSMSSMKPRSLFLGMCGTIKVLPYLKAESAY